MATGKIYDENIIMSMQEAELLKTRAAEQEEELKKRKLEQIKFVKNLYVPKGDFELAKKSNDKITQMYKGVCIELGDGQRHKFLQGKSKNEVKRVKEDNLWRLVHCNPFQDHFRKRKNVPPSQQEPANRYVVVLRGFLNYWIQKKYSRLGVSDDRPEDILEDFMEAYDTQMNLITPDTRQIWLDEFENDPKKYD